MSIMNKTVAGVLLAVAHIGLVGSLGAKLMMDRARYPHVWVKTTSYDPNLFIRGRYVSLRLSVPLEGSKQNEAIPQNAFNSHIRLEVKGDELVAVKDDNGKFLAFAVTHQEKLEKPKEGCPAYNAWNCEFKMVPEIDEHGRLMVTYNQPSLFFIPDTAADPTVRGKGEELWVDATITPKGIPRPIRLGVKKGGKITPLDIP